MSPAARKGRNKPRKRLKILKERGKKVHRVRKWIKGPDRLDRIYSCGLAAAAAYDASVLGRTDMELLDVRRTMLQAYTPFHAGTSHTLKLAT